MSANKTSKYLKYAIGEILLVVIGILIALQINNWNEHRKRSISERSLYINIIKDLDEEHMILDEHLKFSETLKSYYRKIYEYASGKTGSLNIERPAILFQSINYTSLVLQNHEKSVEKISLDSLRKSLNKYLILVKELSIRRQEEVRDIEGLRRPFLMENNIVNVEKILYENTEFSSIDLSSFKKAFNAENFDHFIASGYASNQALIFYTKQLMTRNRDLKTQIENSKLFEND